MDVTCGIAILKYMIGVGYGGGSGGSGGFEVVVVVVLKYL